jgi:GPH family glycoside/pentoside/hexuronide:cation symporter
MSTNVNTSKNISTGKIGFFEKISYACGDFANNIIFSSMGAFLVFYYTDVAKVGAAAIGSIMLISRLLDGIIDIIMGFVVDRTKSKYGKARPWILRMSIPFAVATVLLFSVPNLGEIGKLIYIFLTYNIVNIIYTSINVPYGTLSSLMTQDQYDRSVLNIVRMIFSMVSSLGITMLTLPVVNALGGGQKGWTLAYLAFGIIACILFFITFFFTKERVGTAAEVGHSNKENVPVLEGLKGLFKNKYWVILTANGLANGVNMAISMGVNVYYATYILGNPNLVGTLSMAMLLPMIGGLFILAPFVKKFGKRNMNIAGNIITIVGYVITLLNPTNATMVIIGAVIRGVGTAPGTGVGFAMIADSVEYGEWKTGNRTEGLVFSAQSYGGKAGSGLGGALIGWVLAAGGYVGGAAVQSASAISSIKALFIFIPIAVLVIQILILIPYKLDREYPTILKELQERNFNKA